MGLFCSDRRATRRKRKAELARERHAIEGADAGAVVAVAGDEDHVVAGIR